MKKTIISVFAAALALSSCDLDMYPEDKLVNDQALLSMEDLEKFEIGTYAAFRSNFQPDMIVAGDLQGDYVNATRGFGNIYGALHRWDYTYADYEVRDVWNACYYTIAQANFVISKAETIAVEADEQADFEAIMGEMYFIRAMSLFQLTEKFCGDYNASTATAAATGLPVLTGFDPQLLPTRSTLEETYTQILSDIQQAKTRLAGVAGQASATVLTADCVTALEARVYLQMHNNQEAYNKAMSLISSGKYPLTNTAAALKSIFTYDQGSEVIFVFYASKTELPADYATQFVSDRYSNDDYFMPQYIPSQTLIDLYDDADTRKEAFFIKADNGTCEIGGTMVATPVYLMNKYPGNPSLQRVEGTKNYVNAFKVFRIAEMYLIAAEAAAQISGDAKTPLNALRTNRGLGALDAVTLDDVKVERKREMVFEGNRISDLKRWGDPLDARAPQTGKNQAGESIRLHETGSSYEGLTVASGDFRFVWPIPSDEIYANQNLASQQNPGWDK